MIKRIFLDLDDVLNTLVPAVFAQHGISCTYEQYPVEYGWNITGAVSSMMRPSRTQLSREEFWGRLDREFWATIPKSDQCDWLIKASERLVGRENVYVLTRALHADSLAGKHDWVVENLPEWIHEQMITCRDKHVCAHESLLVDDNQDNVQAFLKAGGQTVMFPRPWNDLRCVPYAIGFLRVALQANFPEVVFDMRSGRTTRMLDRARETVGYHSRENRA